jgi:hypothetical protein
MSGLQLYQFNGTSQFQKIQLNAFKRVSDGLTATLAYQWNYQKDRDYYQNAFDTHPGLESSNQSPPYFGGTDQISKNLKEEKSRAASLGSFVGTPLKSRRFRALARNAARSGKRPVIEIHDQNPVKTISSQSTAMSAIPL